jgi:hypothetical protein
MLDREQYLNLHGQFYDAFVSSSSPTDRYLPYDQYTVPANSAMGPRWLIFHMMSSDLVRELLNSINGYYTNLRRLESWNVVLNQCDEEYRNDFILDILNPAASVTVNYVSLVKQRLIYAGCMLSHQTTMLLDSTVQDSSLIEHRICFNTLQGYRDLFDSIDPLIDTLNRIDNQSFRESTSNFRNLYHHRIPPRFELGSSSLLNRMLHQNGRVSYGLGGNRPLRIGELIPILHDQHQACVEAFQTFWQLVSQQVSIWEREAPNTT